MTKDRLDRDDINKLLWELSIPAILGMLSGAIFNVVDRIFVGRVDEYALTAVGITMPIQIFQMAFILLIGSGSSALVSIKLGERKTQEANQILYLALKYIVIILAALAVLFTIFVDAILDSYNLAPHVFAMAKDYILIIMIGSVISIPGYCLNSIMRAIGKADISMKVILISSVANIILDAVFIFGFNMGVAGAAIATVISQTILTAYVIVYFIKSKDIPINLKLEKPPHEFKILREILKLGSPSCMVQILASFVNTFINSQIIIYGTDLDIGAVTICATIFSFYHMIVFGIVQGNQPICGFNWGAKRYDRVLKSIKLSMIYAFIISTGLFLVIMTYPEIIIKLFTDSQRLVEEAIIVARWYLLMIPLIGLQTISAQYFQAVGRSKLAGVLSLLRYGVIMVPLVIMLAPIFGVNGIYFSYALSDFLASIIAILFITKEIHNLKKLSKSQ